MQKICEDNARGCSKQKVAEAVGILASKFGVEGLVFTSDKLGDDSQFQTWKETKRRQLKGNEAHVLQCFDVLVKVFEAVKRKDVAANKFEETREKIRNCREGLWPFIRHADDDGLKCFVPLSPV